MRRIVVLVGVAVVQLGLALGPLACRTAPPPAPPTTQPVAAVELRCTSCHAGHARQWQDGAHRQVACETCHGPGAAHAAAIRPGERRPATTPTAGARACLGCHPGIKSLQEHLQAVEKRHVVKVSTERLQGQCVYCHDPHSLQ